ncbi:MAG: L-threonylcarbamoyladenylate synthase [Terriglobales bacterium]
MPPLLPISTAAPAPEAIARIRATLDRGGVVALPTDTIYGLAASARDAAAVARVFALKGRDFSKPLPIVVRDLEQAAEIAAELPGCFGEMTAAFWPGPLTLIVRAGALLPEQLTAGTGNVAMRQPDLPFLQKLLEACAYPLTATSANRSGAPECRTVAEVAAQFGDTAELELIVDGGLSPRAQPSTIVDLTAPTPRLVRAGAIPAPALARFL